MKRIVLLTLAGCSRAHALAPATPPPPSTSQPAPPPVAAAEPRPAPIAPRPAPDPPGAWLTRPPAEADFYVALDGICRYLRVSRAGDDAFAITTDVPYILTPQVTILARLTPAGLEDMTKGAGAVSDIGGRYPDALFVNHAGQERLWSTSEVLKWDEGKWTMAFANPYATSEKALRRGYELPVAWRGGFVAVSAWTKPTADSMSTTPGDSGKDLVTYRLPHAEVAPLERPGFAPRSLFTLPSGELGVIGDEGNATRIRWLDTSGGAHEYAPPPPAADAEPLRVDGVRLVRGRRTTVARFDGTTFSTQGLPPDPPVETVAPPVNGALVVDDAWAYTKTDVWRREAGAWKKKTLPPPAFGTSTARSISSFTVLPNGEADLVVGYYEKGPGWRDPVLYHMLLRSVRPAETLRCNEPDPENLVISSGEGFTSWPPRADDACATPFVILGRKSNAHPPPAKDWPQLRSALRGKTALGETIDLVEVHAGDRTFVGVATKTTADARALLDTVAKSTPTRGEIVCAVPQALRTIHVDVKTGKATE